jgi:excisionase family DNA binding protein
MAAPRLGALISHSEKVRAVLNAANGPETIIESATELVTAEDSNEPKLPPALIPQQIEVWKTLLPIVAEHGLLTVRGSGSSFNDDEPLNREEAAKYLGFSIRKLDRYMKKRQIAYEKFGVGRTATVRFHRSELDKYREKRKIPSRSTSV